MHMVPLIHIWSIRLVIELKFEEINLEKPRWPKVIGTRYSNARGRIKGGRKKTYSTDRQRWWRLVLRNMSGEDDWLIILASRMQTPLPSKLLESIFHSENQWTKFPPQVSEWKMQERNWEHWPSRDTFNWRHEEIRRIPAEFIYRLTLQRCTENSHSITKLIFQMY